MITLLKHELLCSGKFLSRQRNATLPVSYSIGYGYSAVQAGVTMNIMNTEDETMQLRMTPEQAEQMAKELIQWADKTREYQKTV